MQAFKTQVVEARDGLWVFGAPGVGKTQSLLRAAIGLDVDYFDCTEIDPEMANALLESIPLDQMLILDRIEHWLGHAMSEAALFSWWKRKQVGHCCIARVSPRHEDLFCLPDLRSRALASLVLSVDPFSDAELERLMLCQIKTRGLDLMPEVYRFLAPRIPRNPAKIARLIEAMDHESLRDQRRITVPWLKQLLITVS